jgi:predicted nucleic acid-binding Zn ribbon protein
MDGKASEAGRTLAAQRRQVTGRCTVCGATFTGTTQRRTCSDACRQALVRERRGQKARSARRLGRIADPEPMALDEG